MDTDPHLSDTYGTTGTEIFELFKFNFFLQFPTFNIQTDIFSPRKVAFIAMKHDSLLFLTRLI
jgi:hypothetical protein